MNNETVLDDVAIVGGWIVNFRFVHFPSRFLWTAASSGSVLSDDIHQTQGRRIGVLKWRRIRRWWWWSFAMRWGRRDIVEATGSQWKRGRSEALRGRLTNRRGNGSGSEFFGCRGWRRFVDIDRSADRSSGFVHVLKYSNEDISKQPQGDSMKVKS